MVSQETRTVEQVANRLVELCRQGEYEAAQRELYHPNAVSLEPAGTPAERVEGLEAIVGKGKQYSQMIEAVHSMEVSDPQCAANYFTCTMKNDVTMRGMGRSAMHEVCVYQVENGQIVQEQFFYPVQPRG